MKNFTKKILTTVILLTVISFVVNGQTNVSGGIYTNTTWTLANSPYVVVDTVVVFPGVTLTIQPGVIVKFENNKRLEIRQAKLIAVGTSTDSITFTSNSVSPTQGIWSAVFLNASTTSKFNYCNFRYANRGIYNDQTGSTNDTLIVKNSNFDYNNFGIYNWWIDGTNEFDSCNFVNNLNGFYTEYDWTPPVVNYCNFSYNQNNGFNSAGGGSGILNNCYVSYNVNLGIKADTIINSTIIYNQTGINSNWITGLIKNCTIRYNTYGVESANIVDSSIVNNNQYGISSATEIKNSTIDSNSVVGIDYRGNITNCQIKYNGTGINAMDSIYTITKNVIENNTIGIELGANNNIFCNKICNNTSYDLVYTNPANISVANNYWCTPDSASTEVVIYDGYDNISYGLVYIMPLDTLQCYLVTGISSVVFQNFSFNIFPNPVSDYLTIELPKNVSMTEIKIFNILGGLTYSSTTTEQKTDIDVSTLTNGMYIIQTASGDKISRQKFIKQ